MPALAGIALIALVYPLGRLLFLNRRWALLATALAASDTLLIIESRLGVLDVLVALWSTLSICLALAYARSGWNRGWLVATGVALGCAMATKWSGLLALLAAVYVIVVMRRLSPPRGRGATPYRPSPP